MFDIIGDIHGHAKELEILLVKLGYKRNAGIYSNPEGRKCIFLGDYIDRGPNIRETLHIVKDMCDAGSALAIMGNHEFNAICFHTKHTENGGFFRTHGLKEIEQHIDTLRQFKHFEYEWNDEFLPWFHTLPIYLELDGFRAVHACWDDNHIAWLKSNNIYSTDNGKNEISSEILSNYDNKKSEVYSVFEELLKGKEYELLAGEEFLDKDGEIRKHARVKWFQPITNRRFKKDVFLGIDRENGEQIVDEFILNKLPKYDSDIPVFFGHYWLKADTPKLQSSNVCCLDYSVANEGNLVAYRFDGEKELNQEKFCW
jgi:hypothetical protein